MPRVALLSASNVSSPAILGQDKSQGIYKNNLFYYLPGQLS
jgi:hypothetical protein